MPTDKINEKNNQTSGAPTKDKPVNLERYQDLEGVTMKKLEAGLWYVEHKKLLYYFFIGMLALIGTVSWLYTLTTFGFYIFKGMNDDVAMIKELVAIQGFDHSYIAQISGQQLQIYPVAVLESGNLKGSPRYDLAVEIKNPNLRHWGVMQYTFVSNDLPLVTGQTNILPGDDKYLMALGLELAVKPTNVKLQINGLNLQRLDSRALPDWEKYKQEHFNIQITDSKFTPPRMTGLSEKINVSQLDFSVANNSAYNYWRTDLMILMSNRGQLLAVNQYLLNRFKSGERRNITISMPGIIKIDKIEIIPQVDILDQNNYFDFDGSANPEAQ